MSAWRMGGVVVVVGVVGAMGVMGAVAREGGGVSAAETRPGVRTAGELVKAAEGYRLGEALLAPRHGGPPVGRPYLWIAEYLGSKDAGLRDAAAEIVATSRKPFDGAVVRGYLGEDRPLNVRMAAAVWAGEGENAEL